jgi:aspartate ammonia-lyase
VLLQTNPIHKPLGFKLQQELKKLSQVFKLQGSKWRFIPKAARTHLQDAVPMTLGQEFSAYGETLKKCADWTAEAREKLRELGIGGSAAGTGLTVPAHFSEMIREHLEKLSGEKLWISKNLFESMQSQASIVYYSSMLRLTALELTRICNDLRLLASGPLNGLHEIDLPAAQPGSSMMPGKVNPSLLEMANQTWFAILGYDHTIACAAQAGQLELNVMMPIIAHSALEATRFSARAIASLRLRCIQGIQPNFARLRRNFENTPQTATVLTRLLGYETTAHLVQEALLLGVSVIELVRKKNLIPESTLKTLLNTRTLTGL